MPKIQRALISVSDKSKLIEFARALAAQNIEILSTGGTAELLARQQIPVTEVSSYTDFPEIMAGRVKTLHPKIHGGLLGRRGVDDSVMAEHGIQPIDLLVVNLYPFEQTIKRPGCDLATALEQIDVGGPAMLRAAAKNYTAVTVIVDPQDYANVLTELQTQQGMVSEAMRIALAQKAFAHTARYDGLIANYLSQFIETQAFPPTVTLHYQHAYGMRYGENPHQKAAFYHAPDRSMGCIAAAIQIQGKELSYNNVADADTALECVKTFIDSPACVIVKHANPCGVAIGATSLEAYQRAFRTDPTSAFGGIIAFNRVLDAQTAQAILDRQFVEVLIAPEITEEAKPILAAKANIRVLVCGQWSHLPVLQWDFKRVNGGLLMQEVDLGTVTQDDLKVVTQRQPTVQEWRDLLFAWKVVKFVKSNAIVYVKGGMTLGVGAGQMSRVFSAKIAALKAAEEQLDLRGSVIASDAFFPFRDGLDTLAEVGGVAVIQPGGSLRDAEVIAAADEHKMTMVFTGMRHFRH